MEAGLSEVSSRLVRERELVLFGAMLADPELRTLLPADWPNIGLAYEDLTPSRDEGRARLVKLLGDIGVEWAPGRGSPVEAIRRHVLADGRIQRAIGSAQAMAEFGRCGQLLDLGDKEKTLGELGRWWRDGQRYFEARNDRSPPPRRGQKVSTLKPEPSP